MADYTIRFTDPAKSPFVIKPYTTNGSQTPNSVLPLHPLAVSSNTSLVLVGKGVVDYGAIIQNNVVFLTENFANTTAPINPLEGQHWYDTTVGQMKVFDGTDWIQSPLSGKFDYDFDLSGQKIVNLADPVNPQDAVSKNYGDVTYVNVAGDTMTGPLVLSGTPTASLHAATKDYVDTAISGVTTTGATTTYVDTQDALKVNKAGDTMTGDLDTTANISVTGASISITNGSLILTGASPSFDAGLARLANVGDPSLPADAATKAYVDSVSGTSGGVVSATFDTGTGELNIELSNGNVITSAGNAAPFIHQHFATDVNVDPYSNTTTASVVREVAANSGLPEGNPLPLDAILSIIDSVAFNVTTPMRRYVTSGNGTTSIDLPFRYEVGTNRLAVYKNGLKLIADERAEARISNFPVTHIADDTGLSNTTYYLNINANGTTHTNVAIDLSTATLPITYAELQVALEAALAVPAYQTVTFSTPLSTGTELTNYVPATAIASTITIDGVGYPISVVDGSTIATINALISTITAVIGTVATVSIVSGKLQISSKNTGSTSSVSITDHPTTPMFSTLNNYSSLDAPVAINRFGTSQYLDKGITILSYNVGNGSQISLLPPSSGLSLATGLSIGKLTLNFGGALTGATSTGLAGATTYTAEFFVGGVQKPISILGSSASTYTDLVNEITTDLGGAGTAAIVGGNIVVTDTSGLTTATVFLTSAGTLFPALSGFTGSNRIAYITNQAVTADRDFSETGTPWLSSEIITFPTNTSGSDVYEILFTPGGTLPD